MPGVISLVGTICDDTLAARGLTPSPTKSPNDPSESSSENLILSSVGDMVFLSLLKQTAGYLPPNLSLLMYHGHPFGGATNARYSAPCYLSSLYPDR